jgi:hypothetical protein
MNDEVEPKKSEEELYNIERVRTLQEALRVDYIEKFDVFAKLKIVQKELTETKIKLSKYEKVNELLSSNNKALTQDNADLNGRHKYEKERAEELEKQIAELKDTFSPVEESYLEPEVEVKPKRKTRAKTRRAKKTEPEE